MLKKTISYEDFNGNTLTEDFYFNLSKAEIAQMELEYPGGLSGFIDRIVKAQDTPTLIGLFKDIILRSYGVKSEDGKHFVKNDKLREEFESHAAFSVLYMELVTNANKASEFMNGIIPADVASKMKELEDKEQKAS